MQLLSVKTSEVSQHLDTFWKVVSFCSQPKNSLLAGNPYRTTGLFVIKDSYFIPFSSCFSFRGQFKKQVQQNRHKKQKATKHSPFPKSHGPTGNSGI